MQLIVNSVAVKSGESCNSAECLWLAVCTAEKGFDLYQHLSTRQCRFRNIMPRDRSTMLELTLKLLASYQANTSNTSNTSNICQACATTASKTKPMLKVGRLKRTSIHSSLTQTQRCGCNSRLIRCNSSNKRITSSVEAFSSCQVLHKRPWSTRCWADNNLNTQSFCQQGACN